MALQNRMALDLVMAAQGGVCAMVGDSCCTYVPPHDAPGHVIHDNVKKLKTFMAAENKDFTAVGSGTWFGWLNWGSWKELVMKAIFVILVVLCVVAVIMCCILPLIRKCVSQMITQVFGT